MVKIKIWGPITWNLLHTIADKIYEDRFIYAKRYRIILLIFKIYHVLYVENMQKNILKNII